jgi:hypothetical protein
MNSKRSSQLLIHTWSSCATIYIRMLPSLVPSIRILVCIRILIPCSTPSINILMPNSAVTPSPSSQRKKSLPIDYYFILLILLAIYAICRICEGSKRAFWRSQWKGYIRRTIGPARQETQQRMQIQIIKERNLQRWGGGVSILLLVTLFITTSDYNNIENRKCLVYYNGSRSCYLS